MECPAWCSGGQRPLIAGCSSLQRLGMDLPVTHPVWASNLGPPASNVQHLPHWAADAALLSLRSAPPRARAAEGTARAGQTVAVPQTSVFMGWPTCCLSCLHNFLIHLLFPSWCDQRGRWRPFETPACEVPTCGGLDCVNSCCATWPQLEVLKPQWRKPW